MGCGDEKLSKYLTQTFTAHCNAMICQQVTLSGDAEWPKVADAVIEAAARAGRKGSCPSARTGAGPSSGGRTAATGRGTGEGRATPAPGARNAGGGVSADGG